VDKQHLIQSVLAVPKNKQNTEEFIFTAKKRENSDMILHCVACAVFLTDIYCIKKMLYGYILSGFIRVF